MEPVTEMTLGKGAAGFEGETRHVRALIYRLGEAEFATDVRQVQEIVRPLRLARPAKILENVEGLIKRRGQLVPVVDLRKRLGLEVRSRTPDTCVVIVRLPIGPVGFIVDAAIALRWIKLTEIEAPQMVLAAVDQHYIRGLAVQAGSMLVMLDLMRVLSNDTQKTIAEGVLNV